MDIKALDNLLKKNMTIDGILNERYIHSLGVAEMAIKLNKIHNLGLDEEKLYVAGLLHDCAKLLPKDELEKIMKDLFDPVEVVEVLKSPAIWHSFAGYVVANTTYGITDPIILNAIYYHSTGKPKMNLYEQIIFVSDYIEERTRLDDYFKQARLISFKSLDEGTYFMLKNTIEFIKNKKRDVYHLTFDAYKYYEKEVMHID